MTTMPKFGKRHYQAIADAMKDANRVIYYEPNDALQVKVASYQWNACIAELVRTLSRDNPRFSETRFKEACNP